LTALPAEFPGIDLLFRDEQTAAWTGEG